MIICVIYLIYAVLVIIDKQIPKLTVTAQTTLSELKEKGIINVRTATVCQRSGCLTVGDLCCHTQEDILKFRNLGNRCFAELISTLREYGFIIPSERDKSDVPSSDDFGKGQSSG